MDEVNSHRRKGRKSKFASKAGGKMITIYSSHFGIIDNNEIELSLFVRWLIDNSQEEYLKIGQPKSNDEGIGELKQTSVSLYNEDLENIRKINNFSNFIRWGLETQINKFEK